MPTKIKHYQDILLHALVSLKDLRVAGLLLFLVVVLLVSWSGVKTIETNYGLQKQISQLEQENTVQKLANDNMKLENGYYQTPQYLELSARKGFGLAAPGETVLVVPEQVALAHTVDLPDTLATPKDAKSDAKKPAFVRNLTSWMDFLLHRESSI